MLPTRSVLPDRLVTARPDVWGRPQASAIDNYSPWEYNCRAMPRKPTPSPDAFLPLTAVVFEILVSLATEARHGYSILVDVRSRTSESIRPGSLYRALNRLLDERFIEELDERPDAELDDERRRYYRLTELGRRVAVAEAARIESQLQSARAAGLAPRRR
jgi:DNA-binding PadR family transcriptional regulator